MGKLFLSTLFSLLINAILFILLLVGIYNNHDKKAINYLFFKTAEFPIGFITGSSFIIGSLYGNIVLSISDINKSSKD